MKRSRAYEKPSVRKTREKAEAIRRACKAARKLAQREGLMPMPKRKEAAGATAQVLSLLRTTFVRCALGGVGVAHRGAAGLRRRPCFDTATRSSHAVTDARQPQHESEPRIGVRNVVVRHDRGLESAVKNPFRPRRRVRASSPAPLDRRVNADAN
jgi:hypothetical protein